MKRYLILILRNRSNSKSNLKNFMSIPWKIDNFEEAFVDNSNFRKINCTFYIIYTIKNSRSNFVFIILIRYYFGKKIN